jgi:hypothetical protein
MINDTASKNELLSYLQRRLERHFLTCTAAVGAAAAVAVPQEADATIIAFDPADIQVPLNNLAGIYINMETGAFGTTAASVPGWDVNIFNQDSYYLQTYTEGSGAGILGYTSGAYDYANRLTAGANIGPGGSFIFGGITTMSYNGTATGGQWLGNTSGFLGVTFILAGGQTRFGWIGVNVTNSVEATITSWAFENNGGAIAAGAVPEPSSVALSLLAAGAAGLGYWRRRKKSQAAA